MATKPLQFLISGGYSPEADTTGKKLYKDPNFWQRMWSPDAQDIAEKNAAFQANPTAFAQQMQFEHQRQLLGQQTDYEKAGNDFANLDPLIKQKYNNDPSRWFAETHAAPTGTPTEFVAHQNQAAATAAAEANRANEQTLIGLGGGPSQSAYNALLGGRNVGRELELSSELFPKRASTERFKSDTGLQLAGAENERTPLDIATAKNQSLIANFISQGGVQAAPVAAATLPLRANLEQWSVRYPGEDYMGRGLVNTPEGMTIGQHPGSQMALMNGSMPTTVGGRAIVGGLEQPSFAPLRINDTGYRPAPPSKPTKPSGTEEPKQPVKKKKQEQSTVGNVLGQTLIGTGKDIVSPINQLYRLLIGNPAQYLEQKYGTPSQLITGVRQ